MNVRWLILSHAFNMDGRAASQTITDKIPHFLKAGIELQVLSAVTGEKDDRFRHDQLLPWGPSGLRFDFRHWVTVRFGRTWVYKVFTPLLSLLLSPFILLEKVLLGLSSHWSWAIPATIRGWWRIRTGQMGLVYSTGGAWSAHLAGWWLKKLTGTPWIVEVHDPLVQRDTAQRSVRKYRDAKAQAWLEKVICRDADAVWWFTEAALRHARERNPELGARGFSVCAGAEPPPIMGRHQDSALLTIAHFGSLSTTRSLAPFLKSLFSFCERIPEAAEKIQVHVYGATLDEVTRALLEGHPLQRMVLAHGRLERDPVTNLSGREQVLKKMYEHDALLLLHGEHAACEEYIPSKVYEYFWTGRPILALTHNNPQLDSLIKERAGYLCAATDPASIDQAIHRLWSDWQAKRLPTPPASPVTVEQTVRTIMGEIKLRLGPA